MPRITKYDDYDRDALIATLLERDEEIEHLKNRTLDDLVEEMIRHQLQEHER